MKRKVKDIIKMRNGSTITITNNSTKDAGKGFNEIYLKEQDAEYKKQLEIESKNFGGL